MSYVFLVIGSLIFMFSKKVSGSYLSIPSILSLYWLLNIFLSSFLFDHYYWNVLPELWIFLVCIVFSLGYSLKNGKIESKYSLKNYFLEGRSNSFIILSLSLALLYSSSLVIKYGFRLTDLTNLDNLVSINRDAAFNRYGTGGFTNSSLMQMLLVFVYSSCLTGGYSFINSNKRISKLLGLGTFLPPVIVLLTENTKATIMGCGVLWLAGAYTSFIMKYDSYPTIKFSKLLKFLSAGCLTLMLLFFSMMLRIGHFDMQTFLIVKNKFASYSLGQIPAFDYWFTNLSSNIEFTFGKYTLFGLFNFLGIADRQQGVFIDGINDGIINTNIFTAWRGLITDYSKIGVIFLAFIIGVLVFSIEKGVRFKLKYYRINSVFLSAFMSFLLYSFTVSIFSYFSYYLAFAVFLVYQYLCNKPLKDEFQMYLERNSNE